MKKIGILTFHNTYNYGAVLQAYALKKTVSNIVGESECEIINYANEHFKKIYNPSFKELVSKHKLSILGKFILSKKRYHEFQGFIEKYIIQGARQLQKKDLAVIENNYEKIIVGSDQVWNLECTGNDTSYFLDFVSLDKKKNSYAASFGSSTIQSKHKETCKALLKTFNKISVRENDGKNIINSMLDKEVEVVLDPTMLIGKEDWRTIIPQKRSEKNNYVLIYAFGQSSSIISFAKKIAKKQNLKIVRINGPIRLKSQKICNKRFVTPLDWLELFWNADYILTNSFHGTSFAINFNKKFYVEFLSENRMLNSRLDNLINIFGLQKRLINEKSEFKETFIDYDKVNDILHQKKDESMAFLHKIIYTN